MLDSVNFNELYYTETHSQIQYGQTPTGNLDVERLIRGQSYWITPALSRDPQPKKWGLFQLRGHYKSKIEYSNPIGFREINLPKESSDTTIRRHGH